MAMKVDAAKRVGSTRIIYPVEPGVIAFQYTDCWSAFDRGSSEQLIPGIGAARCACAVRSFELASTVDVPTHFIEQVGPETIHVYEFSVPGQEPLSGKVHGRVLPLEDIWRDLVFGSLWERIKAGKVDPTSLGFAPGTKVLEGMKLPRMLKEYTTKFEPIDRHLSDTQALELAEMKLWQWDEARNLLDDAVGVTNAAYNAAGFKVPDGKLEQGMLPSGSIMLVDVFGTQDENRIIDKMTGNLHNKDLIRIRLSEQHEWKAALAAAKVAYPSDKSKWPPYPELPADLVALVSERYAEVAYRYAGVRVSY